MVSIILGIDTVKVNDPIFGNDHNAKQQNTKREVPYYVRYHRQQQL